MAIIASILAGVIGGNTRHDRARHHVERWTALRTLRFACGGLVPILAYVVLRAALHSDLAALAITEALPIAWLLGSGLRRRRVDPVALAAGGVLAAAFFVSLAAGGSALPLKLRRAVVTGSLGIICLASVAIGKPILPLAMRWLGQWFTRFEPLARRLSDETATRKAHVLTTIIGLALLADGAAQLTLALTVSTATFLGASRLARITLLGTGLGLCLLYLRWTGGGAERSSGRPHLADPKDRSG